MSETAESKDREIWREIPGEHYCDSAFATEGGGIGFNCGGHCIVQTPRQWQALYNAVNGDPAAHLARCARMEEALVSIVGCHALLRERMQVVADFNSKNIGGKLGPMALPPDQERMALESAILRAKKLLETAALSSAPVAREGE